MKASVYVVSDGDLRRKGNTLGFKHTSGRFIYVPIETVKDVFVFGETTITKKLIAFLAKKGVPVHFFTDRDLYLGTFYPVESILSGKTTLKQAEHYLDYEKRLALARKFVIGATLNILVVLKYYLRQGKDVHNTINYIDRLFPRISSTARVEELLALEGNIRDAYYNSFDYIIQNPDFRFEYRSKHPPRNELNALISFGNALLYCAILTEIYFTHLDPRIGYLHSTNERKFTLNLDVAEIFKPILVDRVIFSLINKGMLKKNQFGKEGPGVYLNDEGRRVFLDEWDKRLKEVVLNPNSGEASTYRMILRKELYKIEKHILDEAEYEPYVSKW
ncbi:MAG: type I-B CRISPR-associated endonuclease Cas1b [candidate division WOR-3 bacterium]